MSIVSDNGGFSANESIPFKMPLVYWDKAPDHNAQALCLSSTGLITGGDTGECILWRKIDSEDAVPRGISKEDQQLPQLFMLGDATGSVKGISLVISHHGTLVTLSSPPHISFSSPFETFAVIHQNGELVIWSSVGTVCLGAILLPLRNLAHIQTFYPTGYYFSEPGEKLGITVSSQHEILIEDEPTGFLSSYKHTHPVLVIAGEGKEILLVDSKSGVLITALQCHSNIVHMALSCVKPNDNVSHTNIFLAHPSSAPAENGCAPVSIVRGQYLVVTTEDGVLTGWDLDEVLAHQYKESETFLTPGGSVQEIICAPPIVRALLLPRDADITYLDRLDADIADDQVGDKCLGVVFARSAESCALLYARSVTVLTTHDLQPVLCITAVQVAKDLKNAVSPLVWACLLYDGALLAIHTGTHIVLYGVSALSGNAEYMQSIATGPCLGVRPLNDAAIQCVDTTGTVNYYDLPCPLITYTSTLPITTAMTASLDQAFPTKQGVAVTLSVILTDKEESSVILVQAYEDGRISFRNLTVNVPPAIITHPNAGTSTPKAMAMIPVCSVDSPQRVPTLIVLYCDSSVAVYTVHVNPTNAAVRPPLLNTDGRVSFHQNAAVSSMFTTPFSPLHPSEPALQLLQLLCANSPLYQDQGLYTEAPVPKDLFQPDALLYPHLTLDNSSMVRLVTFHRPSSSTAHVVGVHYVPLSYSTHNTHAPLILRDPVSQHDRTHTIGKTHRAFIESDVRVDGTASISLSDQFVVDQIKSAPPTELFYLTRNDHSVSAISLQGDAALHLAAHDAPVLFIIRNAFCRERNLLITISAQATLFIWDLTSTSILRAFYANGSVMHTSPMYRDVDCKLDTPINHLSPMIHQYVYAKAKQQRQKPKRKQYIDCVDCQLCQFRAKLSLNELATSKLEALHAKSESLDGLFHCKGDNSPFLVRTLSYGTTQLAYARGILAKSDVPSDVKMIETARLDARLQRQKDSIVAVLNYMPGTVTLDRPSRTRALGSKEDQLPGVPSNTCLGGLLKQAAGDTGSDDTSCGADCGYCGFVNGKDGLVRGPSRNPSVTGLRLTRHKGKKAAGQVALLRASTEPTYARVSTLTKLCVPCRTIKAQWGTTAKIGKCVFPIPEIPEENSITQGQSSVASFDSAFAGASLVLVDLHQCTRDTLHLSQTYSLQNLLSYAAHTHSLSLTYFHTLSRFLVKHSVDLPKILSGNIEESDQLALKAMYTDPELSPTLLNVASAAVGAPQPFPQYSVPACSAPKLPYIVQQILGTLALLYDWQGGGASSLAHAAVREERPGCTCTASGCVSAVAYSSLPITPPACAAHPTPLTLHTDHMSSAEYTLEDLVVTGIVTPEMKENRDPLNILHRATANTTPSTYTPHSTLLPALLAANQHSDVQDFLSAIIGTAYTANEKQTYILPSPVYRQAVDYTVPGAMNTYISSATLSNRGSAISVLFPLFNNGKYARTGARSTGPPVPCESTTYQYNGHGKWRVDPCFTASSSINVQMVSMTLLNANHALSSHFSAPVAYIHAVLPGSLTNHVQYQWIKNPHPLLFQPKMQILGSGYCNPNVWQVCPLLASSPASHVFIKTQTRAVMHHFNDTDAEQLTHAAICLLATCLCEAGASVPSQWVKEHVPPAKSPPITTSIDFEEVLSSLKSPLIPYTLPSSSAIPLRLFPVVSSTTQANKSVKLITETESVQRFMPSPNYLQELQLWIEAATLGPAPMYILTLPPTVDNNSLQAGQELPYDLISALFLLSYMEVTNVSKRAAVKTHSLVQVVKVPSRHSTPMMGALQPPSRHGTPMFSSLKSSTPSISALSMLGDTFHHSDPDSTNSNPSAAIATVSNISLSSATLPPQIASISSLITGNEPFQSEVRKQLLTHLILAAITYATSFWDLGASSIQEANMMLSHLAQYQAQATTVTHYVVKGKEQTIQQLHLPITLSTQAQSTLSIVLDCLSKGFVIWLPYIADLLSLSLKIHLLYRCTHLEMVSSAAEKVLQQIIKYTPTKVLSALAKDAIAPPVVIKTPDAQQTVNLVHHNDPHSEDPAQIIPVYFSFPPSMPLSGSINAINSISMLLQKATINVYAHSPLVIQLITRCLDPVKPNVRKALLGYATSLLHILVNLYPMVSFHQQHQLIALPRNPMDIGHANAIQIHNNFHATDKLYEIVVYDLRTGTQSKVLVGHNEPILGLEFSPSGNTLLSYSRTQVKFWNMGSSLLSSLLGHQGKSNQTHNLTPCHIVNVNALMKIQIKWEVGKNKEEKPFLTREDGTTCTFK